MMNNYSKNILNKFYYKPLQKTVWIKNIRDDIWKCMLVFVRMGVKGGTFLDLQYEWNISYNTLAERMLHGAIYVDNFLQNWFTSPQYWTKQRLMSMLYVDNVYIMYT